MNKDQHVILSRWLYGSTYVHMGMTIGSAENNTK